MRKTFVHRKAAVATAFAALMIGGVAFAGPATAASITPPANTIRDLERVAVEDSGSGAVTKFEIGQALGGETWQIRVQDGKNKVIQRFNANSGKLTDRKFSTDLPGAVRTAINSGYTNDNVLPLSTVEDLAVGAVGGGYLSSGELGVNSRTKQLEWRVTVEQGRVDAKVIVDVATVRVTYVR